MTSATSPTRTHRERSRAAMPGARPSPGTGRLPVPYFASPWTDTLADRRILLLSYHFPPGSATGALRWQKFAGLLAERGWGMDVVAVDPAQLKRPQVERYGDLPPGLRAYGVKERRIPIERAVDGAWRILRRLRSLKRKASARAASAASPLTEPSPTSLTRDEIAWRLSHRDGWRRAYFAWLEFAHDRAWARRAAALARALVEPGVHRVVITCGPGHLVHEAGAAVALATGLPLVVDMRDPWSLQRRLQEHVASPLYFRLAERAERRVMDRASLILMNTPVAAESMARRYPGKRVLPVLNGFDDEPLPPIPPRSRFVVAFAGTIYLDRDPRPLLRAAARIVADLDLTPAQFGLEFIGRADTYDGVLLEEMAKEEGIPGFVRTGPPRSRADALAFLAAASVLVSLPQDSTLSIPSKVYEYLRFPAWILALAEPGSATHRLLTGTGADIVSPDDVDGIAAVLRRCYQAFVTGVRPAPVARDARLSRRFQAARLADALEEVGEETNAPARRVRAGPLTSAGSPP